MDNKLDMTQKLLAGSIKRKFGYSEPRIFSRSELTSELGTKSVLKAVSSQDASCIENCLEGGFLDSYHYKRVFCHEAATEKDKKNLFMYLSSIQEQLGLHMPDGKSSDGNDTSSGVGPEELFADVSKHLSALVSRAPKKTIHDLLKTISALQTWLVKQHEFKALITLTKTADLSSLKKPEMIPILLASFASNPHMQKLLRGQHGAKINEILEMLMKLSGAKPQ